MCMCAYEQEHIFANVRVSQLWYKCDKTKKIKYFVFVTTSPSHQVIQVLGQFRLQLPKPRSYVSKITVLN